MAEPLDSRVEEILQGGNPPLLSRIEKLLKEGGAGGGSVTPEQIAAAVEAYLDEHGVVIDVDSELSSTSEKPVQNKVIAAALQEHDVFIAKNGTTTNAEIYAAFQAGKVVICIHNDDVYYLSDCKANSARFVCPVNSTGYVLSFSVSNNAWYANAPTRFAKTSDLSGYYTKPSGGIPASDLAADVQTSLGKADTALQQHQSLAGYATESYVQTQIDNIPDELPAVTASDNGKVLAVDNGEWSADSPVIVSGTDAQVTNAVNDYLTQYGVPLRLSEEIKQALLDCFENVAWINDDGQDYYDALEAALYPPVDVLSISAVFTQGSATIYDTDLLDTLKQYLVVTATMTDSTTRTLEDADYTLSGTLAVGTSTITVSYGGKTTTFNVTVTQDDLRLNDILTLDGIKNTRNGHDLSATTWEDLSGNENDFVKATGASNVVWNADCAVFDATNRKLGISKNLFGSASAFTIELVTKATGNGSLLVGGVHYGTVLTNRSWSENDNGFRANSYKDSSSLGISSQYAGTNVGWSNANNVIAYIAWVFTGTQVIRYVNGEVKGTYEKAFPSGTAYDNWSIGGPTDSQTVFYRGNVYRIGMSASAMTAGEIAERYAFYRTRFGMD